MIFQEQDRVKFVDSDETGIVIGTAQSIGLMYVVKLDVTGKVRVCDGKAIRICRTGKDS